MVEDDKLNVLRGLGFTDEEIQVMMSIGDEVRKKFFAVASIVNVARLRNFPNEPTSYRLKIVLDSIDKSMENIKDSLWHDIVAMVAHPTPKQERRNETDIYH